jgi:hypothetical protein
MSFESNLDPDLVHVILQFLGAADLAAAACGSTVLRHAAKRAATDLVFATARHLGAGYLPSASRTRQPVALAREWEAAALKQHVRLGAEEAAMTLDSDRRVLRWGDTSGNGNDALGDGDWENGPLLGANAVEFDGSTWCAAAFQRPLQQPVTIMVLAQARGDTTIIDGLTRHFEICHGYPMTNQGENLAFPRATLMTANAHYVKGTTTSHGNDWHLYTALFDGANSQLRVDGLLEGHGALSTDALDGITLGNDHEAHFPLRGAMAEVRVFEGRLADEVRGAIERGIAGRYGHRLPNELVDDDDDDEPAPKRARRSGGAPAARGAGASRD